MWSAISRYRIIWPFFLTHQRPYVCLTDRVIFFYQFFDPVRQWPHHGLIDRVCGMVTDILGEKSDKKTGLWDCGMATDVKKIGPGDRGMVTAGLGQKPERRRPSSIRISFIEKQRTTALKLLPSGSPQIRWHGMEGGEFSFFSWRRRMFDGFWLGPAVTIPRSPGPGFFNISGHTTVSQTGFF